MMRKYPCHAVSLITVVAAGLGPWAPATASARGMAATTCFTVTATVHLAAAPNAVAVNPQTDAVYVTSFGAGTVSVVDGRTNTVTATIRVGTGPDAVAVNPSTNTIYVASYDAGTVSVIDGRTSTVTATILVGAGLDAVAVNPSTSTIYVDARLADSVSVIRGRTDTVVKTIRLPGNSFPEGLATDSETNTIYAADNGSDMVSAIAVCPK